MDILATKRDAAAVESGQWVENIPQMGDLRLKVRGFSSPTVIAARTERERNVDASGRNRDGTVKSDVGMQITREVLIDVVLMDWDNLSSNGKKLKYSVDQAAEYLTNPDFTPFADAVAWAASFVDRGRALHNGKVEKN